MKWEYFKLRASPSFLPYEMYLAKFFSSLDFISNPYSTLPITKTFFLKHQLINQDSAVRLWKGNYQHLQCGTEILKHFSLCFKS